MAQDKFSNAEDDIERKDRELFDRIAGNFASKDSVKSSSLARRYQILFAVQPILEKLGPDISIIDIACGVGAPAKYLLGSYKSYAGIDHSEAMIAAAVDFNKGNQQAQFVTGNIKAVDLPGQSADLILAIGALHHITELDKVMELLKRLAKPGAYFVAIEPYRGNPLVQLLRRGRTIIDRSYSDDQRYFSRQEIRELLLKHDMAEIGIYHQGFFSPPFAQVILRPQWLSVALSRLAIALDKLCDKFCPKMLKKLSWNIVIRFRFP